MPVDRGKLIAFPPIRRGVSGYTYRVAFRRLFKPPGAQAPQPADFDGLAAQLRVYNKARTGPPLLERSTATPNANLSYLEEGGKPVVLVWKLTDEEVAALTWREAWAELALLDGSGNRWAWLEGRVVVQ